MNWMSISITIYETCPDMNRVCLSYENENGFELTLHPTIEEGWEQLHRLEKLLGKNAEKTFNRYDSTIVYYELHGFFGRE